MGAPRAFAIDATHILRGLSAVQELTIQSEASKIWFTYLRGLLLV